jgi:hypothetical protein
MVLKLGIVPGVTMSDAGTSVFPAAFCATTYAGAAFATRSRHRAAVYHDGSAAASRSSTYSRGILSAVAGYNPAVDNDATRTVRRRHADSSHVFQRRGIVFIAATRVKRSCSTALAPNDKLGIRPHLYTERSFKRRAIAQDEVCFPLNGYATTHGDVFGCRIPNALSDLSTSPLQKTDIC